MSYLQNKRALAFLREKLSQDDFVAFLKVAASDNQSPLETSLNELKLSYRARTGLRTRGFRTIYDVITNPLGRNLDIPNFGRKSLNELEEKLAMHGWRIGEIPKVFEMDALGLSVRAVSCLKTQDIYTLRQLLSKSEDELLQMPNFGKKALEELKRSLSLHGYELGVMPPE